jgi:hypothetical protein
MKPRPDWPWPPEAFALAMPHVENVRTMTPAETQAYADEYQRDQIASAQSDEAMAANIKEYAK